MNIKTIEQKAKRYDEALEMAKKLIENEETNVPVFYVNNIKDIFPELKESEDERIRKEIITYIKWCEDSGYCAKEEMIRWITFLEKQGEKKPNPCDGCINRKGCINCENGELRETEHKPTNKVEPKFHEGEWIVYECGEETAWLKSLKGRVQPQPKQEWSEDDERYLNNTISYLKDATEFKETAKLCIDWLKSLRPQNTWKPSNEQMLAIDTAINVIGKGTLSGKQLIELQEQLKKLREE